MNAKELKSLGYEFVVERKGYVLYFRGIEIDRKKRMTHDTRYGAKPVRQELKFWLDMAIASANDHLVNNPHIFYISYGDW